MFLLKSPKLQTKVIRILICNRRNEKHRWQKLSSFVYYDFFLLLLIQLFILVRHFYFSYLFISPAPLPFCFFTGRTPILH